MPRALPLPLLEMPHAFQYHALSPIIYRRENEEFLRNNASNEWYYCDEEVFVIERHRARLANI